MPIRLVAVDDHPLILGGIVQLLDLAPEFQILATCSTAAEGWQAVRTHQPDILLLDLRLPDGDGLHLLRRLDPFEPPAVVILTALQDEDVLLDAVRHGARGIVLKATAPRLLEHCLRMVYQGGHWLTVDGLDLAQRLQQRLDVEADLQRVLTSREMEIVRLVDRHCDNDAIARRLSISIGTVKTHLHHVFDKLRLRGRPDLLLFLRSRGY